MYKSFWGLQANPFSLTPDTSCFFTGGQRQAVLQALIYALSRGDGLVKVIGEVGAGKTILSRMLIESLPKQFEIFYLFNPKISADRILYAIAAEMSLLCDNHQQEWVLHQIHQKLMDLYQAGRRAVLIIDEAQAIPLETLEEIRMLSNLETGREKLLQIVLLGQPELDEKLDQHAVRQIKQRIVHEFYLPRLNTKEVFHYMVFRMQKAGLKGDFPFSFLACWMLAWASEGYCRRLNLLAEKCLFAAFSRQSRKIGILLALRVVVMENKRLRRVGRVSAIASVAAILALLLQHEVIPGVRMSDLLVSKSILESSDKGAPSSVRKSVMPSEAVPSVDMTTGDLYAISLLSVSLQDAMQQQQLASMLPKAYRSLLYYRRAGRWQQFFLGMFDHMEQARSLLQALPDNLQKNRPYIVKLSKAERDRLRRLAGG